jgi:hypothetical protein
MSHRFARSALAGALLSMLLATGTAAGPQHDADLRSRANRAYMQKDYAACGAAFDEVAADPVTRNETDAHNAACCYALAGKPDLAFAALDRGVANGMRSAATLEGDGDLASLRSDPRWPALIAKVKKAQEAYRATVHAELARMYEEDQGDRSTQPIDWAKVGPRDAARLARVKELVAAGAPKVSDDYYHAAMIFQHGETAEEYAQVETLALRAVAIDPQNKKARWLAAAGRDRYLFKIGKPQIYGTQFHKIDGVWTIEPIDRTAMTDAERAKANVPPLAEAEARAVAMNAQERDAAKPAATPTPTKERAPAAKKAPTKKAPAAR